MNYEENRTDGKKFRCGNGRCSGKKSIRADSFLALFPKVPINALMILIFEYFGN